MGVRLFFSATRKVTKTARVGQEPSGKSRELVWLWLQGGQLAKRVRQVKPKQRPGRRDQHPGKPRTAFWLARPRQRSLSQEKRPSYGRL